MLQSIAWQLSSSIAVSARDEAHSPKRVHSHFAPQFSKSFFGAPKHLSAFRALMPRPLFVSIAQSGDIK
jgi:hypothetical protein